MKTCPFARRPCEVLAAPLTCQLGLDLQTTPPKVWSRSTVPVADSWLRISRFAFYGRTCILVVHKLTARIIPAVVSAIVAQSTGKNFSSLVAAGKTESKLSVVGEAGTTAETSPRTKARKGLAS